MSRWPDGAVQMYPSYAWCYTYTTSPMKTGSANWERHFCLGGPGGTRGDAIGRILDAGAEGADMNTVKRMALAGLLSMGLPAVGCWSDGGGARTPTGTCTSDETCPSGFCDRGACAAPGPNITYGAECDPTPPGGYDRCGAYLCINHRCRSCTTDSECSEGLPEVTCNTLPDEPGRRCGRLIEPGPPQPPPPQSEFPKPPSTP